MEHRIDHSAPVVIGGVGGSGTRVFAAILEELRFYMGYPLTSANDNLWFTGFFFRRPDWFTKLSVPAPSQMNKALCTFEEVSLSQFDSGSERMKAWIQALWFVTFRWNALGTKERLKALLRWLSHVYKTPFLRKLDYSDYIGWGWKEPVSFIYIEYLSQHFEKMKYIHVVRDGLDMAFTNNDSQFNTWSTLFGIPATEIPEMLPGIYLDYWIMANKRAIELGRKLLGKRFLVLSFEKLCFSTKEEIEKLLAFLEIEHDQVNIDALCDLVHPPSTIGRHKSKDLSVFSSKKMDALNELRDLIEHV